MAFRKLGRTTPHRLALLRNMVTSLIMRERIETTLPKAKEVRRLADRMVTWAKRGSLAARRQAARFVQNQGALKKLFATMPERFKERSGGYTRIVQLGFRHGDNAPMAILEYLAANGAAEVAAEKGTKRKAARPRRGGSATGGAPAAKRTAKSEGAASKQAKPSSARAPKTAKAQG
ncbi:MAG: 50S ribosomal protein L17 [Deltaproteobacteria bacterium]|nr:50S ribosomal protein L17 [Deltaproteobacteria bacterium]